MAFVWLINTRIMVICMAIVLYALFVRNISRREDQPKNLKLGKLEDASKLDFITMSKLNRDVKLSKNGFYTI